MTYWYDVHFDSLEGFALTLMHDRIVCHACKCVPHSIYDWDKSLDEDTMVIHFRREADALLFMETFEVAEAQAMRMSGIPGPAYLGNWAYVDKSS